MRAFGVSFKGYAHMAAVATAMPSFSDPPFACPPDTVLDLPCPPSVNRIWQRKKAGKKSVFLSAEYVSWKRNADSLSIALGQCRRVKCIKGPFEAHIILQRSHGDLDNRIKALLDWAQSRELIQNDKFCERIVAEWGTAPHGCRLILRSVEVRA